MDAQAELLRNVHIRCFMAQDARQLRVRSPAEFDDVVFFRPLVGKCVVEIQEPVVGPGQEKLRPLALNPGRTGNEKAMRRQVLGKFFPTLRDFVVRESTLRSSVLGQPSGCLLDPKVPDWKLLLAGAGNPIGNLRVKEAAIWLAQNAGAQRGFADDEIAERGEEFSEYLASHGLFVAGSSGVQGEWPKLLLTRADDGLLYLDHTLPDERAIEHYIVKFGRGTDPQLASILRHEAPYMDIAQQLGLRVHASLLLRKRALFIPRFDRIARAGAVTRLAQESIATLTGMPGFEAVPSHDQVCEALQSVGRCNAG